MAGTWGCAVLPVSKSLRDDQRSLHPLPVPPDAVQVNIVYAERPIDDPLLGDSLWTSIDQIASFRPDQRNRLKSIGMRAGVVGANPPRDLQRLLGLTTELTDQATGSGPRRLDGKDILLRSGGSTPIVTGVASGESRLCLPDQQPEVFVDCRFNIHLRLERLQDQWVRLFLRPEIHHGQEQMVPTLGAEGPVYENSQRVTPIFASPLTLDLSVGEMCVFGCGANAACHDPPVPEGLGDAFFRAETPDGQIERLFIIRVADMQKVKPLYRE